VFLTEPFGQRLLSFLLRWCLSVRLHGCRR